MAELNDPLEGSPRLVDLTAQQAHAVAIRGGIEAQGLASIRRDLVASLREELRAVRVVLVKSRPGGSLL